MSANWVERAALMLLSTLVVTSAGCSGGSVSYSFQSDLPAQPGPPPPAAPPTPPPSSPPPAPPAPPPVQGDVLDNGVIRIQMNDVAPMITRMWVNGLLAVPHDNTGADFQMSARSAKGDAYNPTLGGDCRGNPSVLRAKSNWNGVTPGTPATYGLMLEVDPRNYNEPVHPAGCLGPGEILPYDMKFGVTLGDNVIAPRQLLILDLSIRKDAGSTAEDIVKGLSELPVIYLDNTLYRYAYYSADATPGDGQTFQTMQGSSNAGLTHDTRQWPDLTNFFVTAPSRVIMLCDRADAVQAPSMGNCVAIYSHESAQVQASRRMTVLNSLTLITVINRDEAAPTISDFEEHTQRRLVVVGNPDTVAAGIAWAEEHLPPSGWRRW